MAIFNGKLLSLGNDVNGKHQRHGDDWASKHPTIGKHLLGHVGRKVCRAVVSALFFVSQDGTRQGGCAPSAKI